MNIIVDEFLQLTISHFMRTQSKRKTTRLFYTILPLQIPALHDILKSAQHDLK